VTTAIPGVTLTLRDQTTESINVTISPNSEAIEKNIQGFLDAYNAVVSVIHSEFSFSGEAKDGGHLTGDSTLRSVQMQLAQMLTSTIDDLPGNIKALSQLGIKSGNDGTLSIDSDTLSEAISNDARSVAELFSGTSDHSVDGLGDKFDTLIESFVDYSEGILTAKVNGMKTSISSIDRSIERQEEYLDKYEEKLRAQFTAMEVTMSSLTSQNNFLMSV
jgi:flagellar hook-associated protein 2